MSQMGQDRPIPAIRAMSALAPIPTAIATCRVVQTCHNRDQRHRSKFSQIGRPPALHPSDDLAR